MNKKCLAAGILLALGMTCVNVNGECADISIDNAVEMAIERNPDVAITKYGEQTAKARLRQARGQNSISLDTSARFSRIYGKTDGISNNRTSAGPTITASLPIYTSGSNEATIKSNEVGIDIAKLQTLRKMENMRYSVSTAYYDVLEAAKYVDIAKDSVDKYQKHLENVEQLYSAGSKAKIDVLRSSVELSNAKQELIKAENSHDNSVNTLRSLMYMEQSEPVRLTDDFVYVPFETSVEDCVAYAFANRKELKVDEYTLQQKELSLKVAKAGYGPTANLSVSTDWDKRFLPDGDNYDITVGVGVQWNAFDSGVTRGKVDEAKVAIESARMTVNKDKNDIELAVRKDYNSMREAEKRFVSTQDAVRQAEEDYFIASERYKAGEGIMLDIIDAQVALSTARWNYVSAQYDYARYKIALENDIGLNGYEYDEEGQVK